MTWLESIDAECLLTALRRIRQVGYSTPYAKAADGVLECTRIAEEAITDYEIAQKKVSK
jgi:hypothetical protein